MNTWSSGLKERFLTHMPSISAPPKQSKYPNIIGSATGAVSSELTKKNIDDNLKGDNE
ncbi:hypothetical protein J6836_05465 [Providencia sp. R33]|uniref:hypothetical protein n=1 Tax=Providencia sp. R33 TaxID=2828763 RepID=UPI001C5B8715|nr:hypothetical protein [Providencia sp. R33]QXX83831.1 hypothetical protein J6836_05465 [Providencia sp. R33]